MNAANYLGLSPSAVAAVCGLTALPVASLFKVGLLGWLRGPEGTIVPMLVAGSMAGFLVGIMTAERTTVPQTPFNAASTRAGFIAAFVAAALLVLRATGLYARPGNVAWLALGVVFIAAVAILPTTLLAMFAGGVGRALRLAVDGDPERARLPFKFHPIHGLYAAGALALLSPFAPAFLSKAQPPKSIVATTTQPTKNPTSIPKGTSSEPAPSPRFTYSKPMALTRRMRRALP